MVEWNNNSCQTFHDRYRLYTEETYLLKHTENILQRNKKATTKRGDIRENSFFFKFYVYNVLRNILKLYFMLKTSY